MKTIFSLIILAFISIGPVHAQSKDELTDAYKKILQCQAGFKIVAYYIDIYKTLNTMLDKNELKPISDSVHKKLKRDWTTLEDLIGPMKVLMMQKGIDLRPLDNEFYNQSQVTLITRGLDISPKEYLDSLLVFVNNCADIKNDIKDKMAQ
jgi:hypothetical protein